MMMMMLLRYCSGPSYVLTPLAARAILSITHTTKHLQVSLLSLSSSYQNMKNSSGIYV